MAGGAIEDVFCCGGGSAATMAISCPVADIGLLTISTFSVDLVPVYIIVARGGMATGGPIEPTFVWCTGWFIDAALAACGWVDQRPPANAAATTVLA